MRLQKRPWARHRRKASQSAWASRRRTRLTGAGLLLAIVIAGPMGVASAQPDATDFSAAEKAIIARNASLKAALATSPAAVRHALDALAAASPAGTARTALAPRGSDPATSTKDEPGSGFNKSTDPDLSGLQRVSPEAAHDLFQVLKQVGSEKPPQTPH